MKMAVYFDAIYNNKMNICILFIFVSIFYIFECMSVVDASGNPQIIKQMLRDIKKKQEELRFPGWTDMEGEEISDRIRSLVDNPVKYRSRDSKTGVAGNLIKDGLGEDETGTEGEDINSKIKGQLVDNPVKYGSSALETGGEDNSVKEGIMEEEGMIDEPNDDQAEDAPPLGLQKRAPSGFSFTKAKEAAMNDIKNNVFKYLEADDTGKRHLEEKPDSEPERNSLDPLNEKSPQEPNRHNALSQNNPPNTAVHGVRPPVKSTNSGRFRNVIPEYSRTGLLHKDPIYRDDRMRQRKSIQYYNVYSPRHTRSNSETGLQQEPEDDPIDTAFSILSSFEGTPVSEEERQKANCYQSRQKWNSKSNQCEALSSADYDHISFLLGVYSNFNLQNPLCKELVREISKRMTKESDTRSLPDSEGIKHYFAKFYEGLRSKRQDGRNVTEMCNMSGADKGTNKGTDKGAEKGTDKGPAKGEDAKTILTNLYQAEAQVQMEATEVVRAQQVATAAQQALEESSNKVRILASELKSSQAAAKAAADNAQQAQNVLSKHDTAMFQARKKVDELSSKMVAVEAEALLNPSAPEEKKQSAKGEEEKRLSHDQQPQQQPQQQQPQQQQPQPQQSFKFDKNKPENKTETRSESSKTQPKPKMANKPSYESAEPRGAVEYYGPNIPYIPDSHAQDLRYEPLQSGVKKQEHLTDIQGPASQNVQI